jgi:dTDP-4-amino-4,6-dideoxygalactose transaminase
MSTEMGKVAIPFLKANFPRNVHHDLLDVLESGYVGAGESIERFEKSLQCYLGGPPILLTSSCTAALTLAFTTAGVRDGTTVLSTPMTCAATNIPLLQLGAKIEWLDVEPSSGNVTPETVLRGLDEFPEARLVVIMDWGGTPCEYSAIARHCHRRGVLLILDAAQSFGTGYQDRLYPHDVDYVCYSFGPTKLLSAIEGGGIGTKRTDSYERIKTLRWYGIARETRDALRFWDYNIQELGYRFVSNNLFATVGLRMLSFIEERLRIHRNLAAIYDTLLAGTQGLRLGSRPPHSTPNFWLYTILVERRARLMAKLHSLGIHAATPHQRNDHLLKAWNSPRSTARLEGLTKFCDEYVCLPIGPWLHPTDVEKICQCIRSGW